MLSQFFHCWLSDWIATVPFWYSSAAIASGVYGKNTDENGDDFQAGVWLIAGFRSGVQLAASARPALHICHHRHGITGEFPCALLSFGNASMMLRSVLRSCVVSQEALIFQKVSHTAGGLCQPAVLSSVREICISG